MPTQEYSFLTMKIAIEYKWKLNLPSTMLLNYTCPCVTVCYMVLIKAIFFHFTFS